MEVTKSIQENTTEQASVFSALADPTRLKLVKLLCRQRDPDALCVNALAGFLGVTQSAVSQHLRVLRAIGLVTGQRRGYHIHYSINPEAVKRCQKMMSVALSIEEPSEENLCQNCNEGRKQNVSRE
jgi:DNA-binding transcriptional ArsR family regulator